MKKCVRGNEDREVMVYMKQKKLGNFSFYNYNYYWFDECLDRVCFESNLPQDGIECTMEEFKQEIGMISKQLPIFN